MRPTVRYASFLIVTALLTAACGGGDDATAPVTQATTTTQAATTTGPTSSSDISAAAEEFSFSPDGWMAGAGSEVTLQFENQGAIFHTWVILSSPIESESEFSEDLIVFETSAAAGEAVTITFTAPAAGTHQVICKVPGHFNAGMEGLLTVTGA